MNVCFGLLLTLRAEEKKTFKPNPTEMQVIPSTTKSSSRWWFRPWIWYQSLIRQTSKGDPVPGLWSRGLDHVKLGFMRIWNTSAGKIASMSWLLAHIDTSTQLHGLRVYRKWNGWTSSKNILTRKAFRTPSFYPFLIVFGTFVLFLNPAYSTCNTLL